MIILCLADEFRRVAVEVLLPYFTQRKIKPITKKRLSIAEEEFQEVLKPEYDYFEDYLELVI